MNCKYTIPVFLSSDDNYAPLVATTIVSICEHTNSFIEFYVLDGGIIPENKQKILSLCEKYKNLSIEFINIDCNKVFDGVEVKNQLSLSAFNRLLIPELKPALKKVIYLDVDIIALGDIAQLYNENLDDYIIAAVPDNGAHNDYYARAKTILEMDANSTYFNSGVMLFDCEKWRENVHLEDLLAIEKKYRKTRLYNDQDILNKYFDKRYKILDIKYNVMVSNSEVILRHLTDRIKPWNFSSDTESPFYENIKDFWLIAQKTLFFEKFKAQVKDEIEQKILLNSIMVKQINKIGVTDKDMLLTAIEACYKTCCIINELSEEKFKLYAENIIIYFYQMLDISFKHKEYDFKKYVAKLVMNIYKICNYKLVLKPLLADFYICPLSDFEAQNFEEFGRQLEKYESLETMGRSKRIENLRQNVKRKLQNA